ncbi:ribosomal protein S5 domain 2-like protein [Dacryopinax primogenitus]|uniref:Ribosomal protein S5 domain 2-like protein n=1 Tax=Dacryopinax primogenitus (strain DJM 731) TaxID=1858805 RepID=M5FSB8_DACPD|nr:ribosomal protein S5 domain 2-like protein [Dacryopinax primogenitus]EJT98069.1 ribosomal protein S5 domain 2-like protein [Dacryopinax primogenitus]
MPRDVEPSINQRDFIFSAIQQGLRVDGRSPLQARKTTIRFGNSLGWVECSIGETRVVAQISATVTRPYFDRPFEGIIVIHTEFSPMASSAYETGRPSEEEITMARILEKTIRRSEALDREALCILAGQKVSVPHRETNTKIVRGQQVWTLRLTIQFLADEGNLLDCACMAAMAALRHFRKPEVEVVGDEATMFSPEERAPVPLALHHQPLCVSFVSLGPRNTPVMDPSRLEEQLAHGKMTISLNAQKEICVLQKAGGVALPADEVLHAVNVAVSRVRDMSDLLNRSLEEDSRTRVIEVR